MTKNTQSLTSVLIVYNVDKAHAEETVEKAEKILNRVGIHTRTCPHHPRSNNGPKLTDCAKESDVVVVLGGDGTILGVVRQLANNPKPLFGINLGGFGFLTSCAIHELETALQSLIDLKWEIQHRYFLEAKVVRNTDSNPEVIFQSIALNEALITRSQPGRLLDIWVGENQDSALAYRADGLILATATGSTGHSLSAGGPILEPHLAALIITPVSPHSLFNRPLVFGGEKELQIWFDQKAEELIMILDGQIRTNLNATDKVIIRRSQKTYPTISMPDRTFSQVLQYKFNLRGTP